VNFQAVHVSTQQWAFMQQKYFMPMDNISITCRGNVIGLTSGIKEWLNENDPAITLSRPSLLNLVNHGSVG